MRRTLEDIDADIAEVRKAKQDLLLGRRPQSIKRGDREVAFGSDFRGAASELDRELLRLRVERSRVTGDRSPLAPFTPSGLGRS